MQCLECNKEFKAINSRHLSKCCGLTTRDYLDKHPGAELIDKDVRKSYGKSGELNNNWRGGVSQPNCEICNKKLSQHNYVKRCLKCRDIGKVNHFFGKKHSIDTKEKMKISASMRDPNTYKGGVDTSENISRRSRLYWQALSSEEKAKHLAHFIKSGHDACRKNKDTLIERKIESLLNQLNITFQKNVPVGRYFVDFLIGDKIIECYGDYWHINPKIYDSSYQHKYLAMTAQEKWDKDAKRMLNLENLGYQTIIFWESDIKNNIDGIKDKIIEFIIPQN